MRQDVPEYAWLIAHGDYDRALEVIMSRNPLPGVTGYVCTQLCQRCCTRSAGNYDQPVAIRALKRFVAEAGRIMLPSPDRLGRKVAIIGGGPAGLSAAYFLTLNGIRATIFEARDRVGGMMCLAPAFRLPPRIVQQDVDRILQMGVELNLSHPIRRPPEQLVKDGFDAVFIAGGFQKDAPLHIEGSKGLTSSGRWSFCAAYARVVLRIWALKSWLSGVATQHSMRRAWRNGLPGLPPKWSTVEPRWRCLPVTRTRKKP